MKIQNTQPLGIQEPELQRAKNPQAPGEFDRLFNREVQSDAAEQAKDAARAAETRTGLHDIGNPALLEARNARESAATARFAEQAQREADAQEMEGMFAALDSYAGQLAQNGKANMRQAYSLLENLAGSIADFRARHAGMEQNQPELAALVNELDVLATTETFKFNRGDYSM
jgi:hypothetical protein